MSLPQRFSGAFVLQTVVAMLLALGAYVVVFALAHAALYLFYRVQGDGPGAGHFFAQLVAAWFGVTAARGACDITLKDYSRRAVFVMFAAFSMLSVVSLFTPEPWDWKMAGDVSTLVVTTIVAVPNFWLVRASYNDRRMSAGT